MPIYEYVCKDCGKDFEVVQKISDAPLKKCEKCGGKLEKVISRTAFQLKGSGWYADGYSKEKPAAKKTETKSTETKSTDAKPSAKPAAKTSD